MGDDEKTVEPREVPGPGPRTPAHPGPEKKHTRPDGEEPTSPSPYADDFEGWVADETSGQAGSDDR